LFENIRFCESVLPIKFDDATFHIAANESGVLIWRRKGSDKYEGASSLPTAPWTSILANEDWFFHAGKPK
jgi:hypothetical protein